MPTGDQKPDDLDHPGNMLGGARLVRRHKAAQSRHILVEDLGRAVRQLADRDAALGGAGVDLVIDIGDVADIGNVIGPIQLPQQPEQHIEDNNGASIADMGVVIDRWSADIHADVAGIVRDKILFSAIQRVIEAQIHENPSCHSGFRRQNLGWDDGSAAPASAKR